MLRLAMLFLVASCVGTANSNCGSCIDDKNSTCSMSECSGKLSNGEVSAEKTGSEQAKADPKKLRKVSRESFTRGSAGKKNGKTLKSKFEDKDCETRGDCKKSLSEDSVSEALPAFTFDSSQATAPEVVLLMTTSKDSKELTLEDWRQKTECTNCTSRKKIDVLTVTPPAGEQGIDWGQMAEIIEEHYDSVASLQIIVFPGLQEPFLKALEVILEDAKRLDRVIFLDPGAVDGLNAVLAISSSTPKLKKLKEKNDHFPSLEILALNTGRAFEQDRRRVLAGHANFFYVELALSDSVGVSYLVDWFLTSRLGLNGPLVYGKASKDDIEKIRRITPAAWFQRTSGSKTEDVSDDTLTLMLP